MLGANGTCIRLRNFTRTRAEGPTFDSPGQAQRSPGIARPPEPRALKARYQHFPFRHFNFPISPFQLSHFAISTFPFRHFNFPISPFQLYSQHPESSALAPICSP
jgi:hypothetical protein